MRVRPVITAGILLVVTHIQALAGAEAQPLPVRNGRPVVATVNRDAISLDEFVMQPGSSGDRARLRQGVATAGDLALLDRLVNVKLVAQEAARMGLDETPEIRKQVEVTSREILREILIQRVGRNAAADPAAVEKVYRESVREWKATALLFKDEAAARRAQKEIAGGASFADVSARAIAAKAARADGDNVYHGRKQWLPPIAEALNKLRVGQVSPVIRVDPDFVVLKVVDIRYPENPEARAAARKTVLDAKRRELMNAHDQAMRRQYVVVNKGLLKAIDYEAPKPGLDALLADKRVVADIKGGAQVTVADLTDYLRMQFFHGTDQAGQRKRMNSKKEDALDSTVGRRLLNMEALKLGLDKTNEYRDRVNGYKESLVFDAFIRKVIAPENKMKEDDVKRYYNAHVKDYSYPEMIKLRGLAFTRRASAENAVKKLREGADYNWVAANTDGQVDKGAQGLLTFDGRPVMTSSMPEGVQKALGGSKAGEFRLYASPEGHYYALAIQQVIAAAAKPYTEVREDVAKKAYGEKLDKSIKDYTAKLRAQSKVATYLKKVR